MSTFFVEQLRLKDPVKSALAFHDQGIMSLKSWASKTEEERTEVSAQLYRFTAFFGVRGWGFCVCVCVFVCVVSGVVCCDAGGELNMLPRPARLFAL